jgi:integrase
MRKKDAMGKRRAKGEGSITYNRSKGKWQGSYLKPDGRRGYVYAKSQRKCAQRLKDLCRRVDSRLDVVGARAPLSAFLTHWLEEHTDRWKSKTREHYELQVRRHITPYLGTTTLEALNVTAIQRWQRQLRSTYDSTDLPGRALRTLRTALNDAVRWRIIGDNPANHVKPTQHTKNRGIALSEQQVTALLNVVKGHRLEALYHLALELGLRRGELVALKWADVDLNEGTLTVQHGKTAAATRTLPLTRFLVGQLRQHWQRQVTERAAIPLTWQEHGYVFASEVGTAIDGHNLWRQLKGLAQRAGLPSGLRFHDLRHTVLTRLGAQGKPPAVVQAIAGHSTPALALQVYTHIDLATLRAALGDSVDNSVEDHSGAQ